MKPVDGDGEEKANFREAGDGIGPAEDHESVLDNDEKVVEIHAPDLKGKPFDGGVAGKVEFEDAVVADVGAAIMLIAERNSAAELARGHEVAAKSSRFGLGHRWFLLPFWTQRKKAARWRGLSGKLNFYIYFIELE